MVDLNRLRMEKNATIIATTAMALSHSRPSRTAPRMPSANSNTMMKMKRTMARDTRHGASRNLPPSYTASPTPLLASSGQRVDRYTSVSGVVTESTIRLGSAENGVTSASNAAAAAASFAASSG